MLPVAHHVLLGLLDVALVEQRAAHDGVVTRRVGHRGGGRVPGQLPPALHAQVHIEARPAVEGQGVEERLHGVQDTLREEEEEVGRGLNHLCQCVCVFSNPPR